MHKVVDGVEKSGIIKTTVGKIIFNESIPQDLGYVDRTNPETEFDLEVDFLITKKTLGKLIDKCYIKHGPTNTSIMLDKIKALGYHYSSIGAVTVAASDMIVPEAKYELLKEAEETVEKVEKMYKRGFISEDERYEKVIEKWSKTTEDVANALMDSLDKFNPIFMMADSGARGSKAQIKQLAGMRGLMAAPSGKIIELPIKASFREGLDVLEYFISTHGARKGNADTALKTADSGYLTRRLVDVSQDVIVREEDCGTDRGLIVSEIKEGNEVIEGLAERLYGRYTAEDVYDPESGELLLGKDQYIESHMADRITAAGVKKVKIRSVFTCNCKVGVCAKCYGMNMATAQKINIGEAVGIIAAQSIGEPGTQLTMRTFHTGGVATGADITQGLPRVEELFEARNPKGKATISEISGTVSKIEDAGGKFKVYVKNDTETREHVTLYGAKLRVEKGDKIEAGDRITEGSVSPKELLAVTDPNTVQQYILKEVQKVYRSQGVDISDKHVEIIAKRMISKVRIMDAGDTLLVPSTTVSLQEFTKGNKDVIIQGKKPAIGQPILLGITKAALETDSFLSAASFQETTRILTEASVKGKVDKLQGLKENVIIGKLIPAGTGAKEYMDVGYSLEKEFFDEDASEVLEEEFLD